MSCPLAARSRPPEVPVGSGHSGDSVAQPAGPVAGPAVAVVVQAQAVCRAREWSPSRTAFDFSQSFRFPLQASRYPMGHNRTSDSKVIVV